VATKNIKKISKTLTYKIWVVTFQFVYQWQIQGTSTNPNCCRSWDFLFYGVGKE